jgi:hypothetical protein
MSASYMYDKITSYIFSINFTEYIEQFVLNIHAHTSIHNPLSKMTLFSVLLGEGFAWLDKQQNVHLMYLPNFRT